MISRKKNIFNKPYIVAEIGVNYYDIAQKTGSTVLEAAMLMIKEAKKAGADAVKFQTYKAETLASKKSPAYWDIHEESTRSQYELFKKYDSFTFKEYRKLAEYCKDLKIDFISTPFDLESVDYLDKLVKFFKIASADITNYPLIKKIATKNKPILFSTGGSTIKEIKNVAEIIGIKNQVVILHCVLSYPTKNEDANLQRIITLKKEFPKYYIGYSDHTLPDENMIITTAAYILGAKVIEKHFTLDKTLKGNDHYHAMDTEDLKKLRSNLDLIDIVMSKNEINYLKCESVPRTQARRSIVAKRSIAKGKVIEYEDIICKRPGTGISPVFIDKIIGNKSLVNIDKDDILNWKMIKGTKKH